MRCEKTGLNKLAYETDRQTDRGRDKRKAEAVEEFVRVAHSHPERMQYQRFIEKRKKIGWT